jgi:hypothetical protein
MYPWTVHSQISKNRFLFSLFFYTFSMTQTLVKIIADFNTTLVNKTAVGATTATLTTATDDDGVAIPTGVYGFTIDRNNSSKEFFTATLTGTALTDIKTITRGTGLGTA